MYDYPPQNQATNWVQVLIAVVFLGFGVGAYLWRKYSISGALGITSQTPVDSSASSAILSYYSAGHMLFGAGRGTLNDMKYSLFVTLPAGVDFVGTTQYSSESATIYNLELPFNTQSHFVGLSKDHKIDRFSFENFLRLNNMEKVTLEGDFSDYFDIYAAKGQQFEVRVVLDPEAMQTVIEYCRSHFWEVNNAELYFAATSGDTEDVPLVQASQKFIEQIRPALLPGMPGAAVVHHEVPYGEYDGPPLPCPLCQKIMYQSDVMFTCPDGEGIFINARNLLQIHSGEIKVTATSQKNTPHNQLTCPNCKSQMVLVKYEEGSTMIDSCPNCPYRWLDTADISGVIPKTV